MIRERVLRIHVDDKALVFDNDDQIKVFNSALGSMVSYGMRADINEGLEHVELFISEDKEITAAFYPQVIWLPSDPSAQIPFLELAAAIDKFKDHTPYVIGAALRPSGEYSFQS